ncbi:hypothetical protein [Caballeronia sp. GAFFF1]|uniref:hypothetical protein n=1 Tax=Caballeronia sp. GAFFF1 TaxID=2921779 RepID=UPI0020284282|nr:hypothetical protein [Caballeronia sp. GAFFF1]
MRLNGMVHDVLDAGLYDALSAVTPRKRMSVLRRLANLGLMVEQGVIVAAAAPDVTGSATPATVAEPGPVVPQRSPAPASSPGAGNQVTTIGGRNVPDVATDAIAQEAPMHKGLSAGQRSLMKRMDMSIMN